MSQAGGKQVEIIPLARKKMAQRGIPVLWVAHKRLAMEEKERLLRVVYEETETTLIVVTAYLTSDLIRYWRETS